MLIELFLFSTLLVSLLVGCRKKNEAGKLKPRNLDGAGGGTPTGAPAPAKKSSKESNVAPAAAGAAKEKKEEPEEKMPERPADDNETINDAKSNWGTVA